MSEWRPIETAPKDGTILRVKNDAWMRHGLQSVMRARFSRGEWEKVPKGLTLSGPEHVEDPTHWQPLPEETHEG